MFPSTQPSVARMVKNCLWYTAVPKSTLDAERYRKVAAVDSCSIADRELLEYRARIVESSGSEIAGSQSAGPDSRP